MYNKKNIVFFICFFFIACYVPLFSQNTSEDETSSFFSQQVYSLSLASSNLFLKTNPVKAGMGVALNLDMIFSQKKTGFSFFIHNLNAAWFYFPTLKNKYDIQVIPPVTSLHFLFGYTYGCGTNFEISAGIGPGVLLSPVFFFVPIAPPAVSTEIAFIKYFNKKYGLYISALNSFTFKPAGTAEHFDGSRYTGLLFMDVLTINLGISFRLF